MTRVRGASSARVTLFALLVFVGLACQERERDNPFDPRNSDTNGVPRVLEVSADDGAADFTWNLDGWTDWREWRVSVESGGIDRFLFRSSARVGVFRVDSLTNEAEHRFRFDISDQHGRWLETEVQLARPGTARVFAGDAFGGGVSQLSPDGRDLRRRIDSGTPYPALSMNPDGGFWAADYYGDRLTRFSPLGEARSSIAFPYPLLVARGRSNGRLWIASPTSNRVALFEEDGSLVFADSAAGTIEALVSDDAEETAWTAAREGVVRRWNAAGLLLERDGFVWPTALAVREGEVWIGDRGSRQLLRLMPPDWAPSVLGVSVQSPLDLAWDGRGGIWIADPERGGLVRTNAEGDEIAFSGVGAATRVTRDPVRDELWVILASGEVLRTDGEGAVESRLPLGGRPTKVEGLW